MQKTQYPINENEWAKYLTIKNYYTLNEISYRKSLILESNCDFDKIVSVINEYRKKQKNIIYEYNEKKFYFVETQELQNRIDKIKDFF